MATLIQERSGIHRKQCSLWSILVPLCPLVPYCSSLPWGSAEISFWWDSRSSDNVFLGDWFSPGYFKERQQKAYLSCLSEWHLYIHKLSFGKNFKSLSWTPAGHQNLCLPEKHSLNCTNTLYKKKKLIIDVRTWPPHDTACYPLEPGNWQREHNLCCVLLFDVICRDVF